MAPSSISAQGGDRRYLFKVVFDDVKASMDTAYTEFLKTQQGAKKVPKTITAALQDKPWRTKVYEWASATGRAYELGFFHNVLKYQQNPDWGLANDICKKYLEDNKVHAEPKITSAIRKRINLQQ